MPCFATGSAEGDARLALDEVDTQLTQATRAACEMAKMLRSEKPSFSKLSAITRAWVADHDAIDRQQAVRKEKETEDKLSRKKALKKLSVKERKLLGIR